MGHKIESTAADPVAEALRHAESVSYDVAQGIEQFLRALPAFWEGPDGRPVRAVYDAQQLAGAVAAARQDVTRGD